MRELKIWFIFVFLFVILTNHSYLIWENVNRPHVKIFLFIGKTNLNDVICILRLGYYYILARLKHCIDHCRTETFLFLKNIMNFTTRWQQTPYITASDLVLPESQALQMLKCLLKNWIYKSSLFRECNILVIKYITK